MALLPVASGVKDQKRNKLSILAHQLYDMKYLFTLFAALLITVQAFAQVKLNAPGNFFLKQLKALPEISRPDSQFIEDYDLLRFDGEYHIGVLALVDEESLDEAALSELGVLNHSRAGEIYTFRVPLTEMEAFLEVSGLRYLEIAEPVAPYLNDNTIDSRADSVHQGLGGISQAFTGEGVVVAIIDWGFDYTHPTFYDDDLNELRLTRAWDQNKLDGTPPAGYDFGAEYVGVEELLTAKHDTDYVFGPGTHGTHVAGIAGGAGGGPDAVFTVVNEPGQKFIGAAPESELVFISLRRDAPSLIDAFTYVKDYAESVNKPFVVNMSFGSHLGPHDGMDLKNVGIDNLQGPGRIFVGSAGNNGTGSFHLDRDFSVNPDTLITVVTIHSSSNWGQTLSMWGSSNSSFVASVSLANSDDELVLQTPFYNSLDEEQLDTLMVLPEGEFQVRVLSTAAFTTNDKPNIRMEVRNTTPFRIVLKAISEDSHLHIWSNARMQNRYTNWGSNLTSQFPGAVSGDVHYAMGEPGGCGKSVITVGAYRAERYFPDGSSFFGNIAGFSSRGPTVDGRVKPDISSGGVNVLSAVNSYTTNGIFPFMHDGRQYAWDSFSGTSMSGPQVAGVVALILQSDPELTSLEMRQLLRETARQDIFTGEIGDEGHLRWGWGKANALAAILATEFIASTDDRAILNNDFVSLFPNPGSEMLNIRFEEYSGPEVQVAIFDLSGKMMTQKRMAAGEQVQLSVSDLPQGLYLVRVESENYVAVKRYAVSR